ncbi:MAG: GumC family protein [Pseudomonadota bacterium]
MDQPENLPHAGPNRRPEEDEETSLLELLVPLAEHWKLLAFGPLLAGLVALAIAFVIPPTFTASTTFLPPQQQQSASSSVLASLGALGSLAGLAGGTMRTPADQYVALMQSVTVADRVIDALKLMDVYDAKYRVDARKTLAKNVRFSVGKKDGLITVQVDDDDPQRAADIANRYVDELRRMTDSIAMTEAQQRRRFFENQLQQTQKRLVQSQQILQASGLTEGALKAEPKAAAEGYARLKAQVTAAEVRLHALRGSMTDAAPEVQQQQSTLTALRRQLAQLEQASNVEGGPDYVSKYREFKYQETLFELYARQFELARMDESREGALIQVVDRGMPPERKSKPKRAIVAVLATLLSAVAIAAFVLIRDAWRRSATDPSKAQSVARLRQALHLRQHS